MMRRISFIVFCLSFLFGCGEQQKFIVFGEVDGMEGDTLFLAARNIEGRWDTLGVVVVESRIFRFEGSVPRPLIAQVQGKSRHQVLPLFLENQSFHIYLNKGQFEQSEVNGGGLQKSYNEFMMQKADIYKEMPELEKAFAEARKAGERETCRQLIERNDELDSIYRESEFRFLKEQGNSLPGLYVVFKQNPRMRFERLKPMYDLLSDEMKDTPYGKIITQRYLDAKITAKGEIAPDFTLLTPEGDSLSLYSVKAKVKILDFWASWCGPCRAENPNMVAIYHEFKERGLEIISVSLDSNREAWLKAIKEDGLTWRHVSDLKGWQSSAAQLYKISAVPSVFVLDATNRIVGSYVRGENIRTCVQGLL